MNQEALSVTVGQFTVFLSTRIKATGIVIVREEDIKDLALEVYGKLVALQLGKVQGTGRTPVQVIYDRNPLLGADQKALLVNNFHKWVKTGFSRSFTVEVGGKDKDIWVSSADYVAGLTR
ncbi:hypothetical protein [Metallosphaera javensis (ex Sakai et al. 2022)]|uniref:hypothetical protein n=1 Tax=Metallosphaera javensis (ex Sakai et al. 2022) TaxID=2775498 RepID=UPI00258BD76E|nr:MAG: hypothetical protein MjAS7_0046 [Metallosphaera javensis (ex Sakai et al. 2022)]